MVQFLTESRGGIDHADVAGNRIEQLAVSDPEGNDRGGYSLSRSGSLNAFRAAASTCETADIVSEVTAKELLSRLDLMIQQPKAILDAGSGGGRNIRALLKRYSAAKIIALEPCHELHAQFAPNMVERLRWRSRLQHCADPVETAQLKDASVDLVFANQLLQWCELRPALQTFRRLLTPGGLLCFATVGPDSLSQLRRAWLAAAAGATDPENRVHRFFDMHDLGDELVRCGFSDVVVDMDYLTLTYPSTEAMFSELRASGCRNVRIDRPDHLTGKALFRRFIDQLESNRNADGLIELTIETVYGQAWVAQSAAQSEQRNAGSIPVSFNRPDDFQGANDRHMCRGF